MLAAFWCGMRYENRMEVERYNHMVSQLENVQRQTGVQYDQSFVDFINKAAPGGEH
nr:MAG TPA: hypothetical protein [Caudoviricetes sp.]